ncbi:MAG: serine/threonine protein kinase [Phycisphaerae bacterium]|nr:serine/threonine protein kinase [Phycisphaerae bacterium]
MSSFDDTQLARLVVERKLCSSNEVEFVLNEQRHLLEKKGKRHTLQELLLNHGYITHSQVNRLSMAMDEDSMYRPAQQIPGFQILSKVGQGAMAVVFKAKQLSLDRVVAIKVLPKRLSENPEFVERFYREGRAAARLNHPHIVQAYDVGESSGYHYFVMEYIDGQTVHELLTDGRPLAEQDAVRIVRQVAEALAHAHRVGLIHRDVKPKNVMLTKEGIVKLADMGLAREVNDYVTATAEAGRAYGTPYYISPEQIRGEITIDGRADIYALGATFYHMVAGKVPFDGSSPSAVMHKHLKEQLVPPDHINHSLSSGCGEIIEVMMAKSADERYPSMEEVLMDLEAISKGEPPLQARKRYDHELLQTLATRGKRIEEPDEKDADAHKGPGVPPQLVLALGVFLGLSILLNILLFVTGR